MGRSLTAATDPPAAPRSVPGRLWAPVLVGAAGLTALATLSLRDPHRPGSYGICPVWLLTGYYCPGCGGLRAVNDLAQLRILDALGSNALAVAIVVLGGLGWLAWLVGSAGGPRLRVDGLVTPNRIRLTLLMVAFFSIYRNTPWGSWLAP